MSSVLLVLAKAPEAGSVKTRLCPPAAPRAAADIAAAALLDTLDAARAVDAAEVVVALSGNLVHAERGGAVRAALRECTVLEQRGADFANRIANAHGDAAAASGGGPILQIGMDTPQVTGELLGESTARLDDPNNEAVFGHAYDGGWWALGLREPGNARLLTGVPTSRPDTGVRTEKVFRDAGIAVAPLPRISDADTAEDARRIAELAPESRFAAAVARFL